MSKLTLKYDQDAEMTDERGEIMAIHLLEGHDFDINKDRKNQATFFHYNIGPLIPQNKDARILDIGAGLGQFLHYCRDKGYSNLKGIDLSPSNTDFCVQLGLDVECTNAFDFLEENKATFDFIHMSDVIEHFTKPQVFKILGLIRESLVPGGKLVMKTYNMANPILGVHGRYADITHEIGWTEESFRQVLPSCGYADMELLPSNLYVFYKNPLNYVAMFVAWIFELFFLLYFKLHGRKNVKIFTKNLIAVGYRPTES